MPTTYEPIATTTLGSAQSSVTFSSISGSYTDLVLVMIGNASSGVSTKLTFNSDTGSNYSQTHLYGDGSTAASGRSSNASFIDIGGFYNASSSGTANHILQIMNYSNSTTYKTVLTRGNMPTIVTQTRVGLWRSTAAITSIKLEEDGGVTFSSGSTFTLYGIKAA